VAWHWHHGGDLGRHLGGRRHELYLERSRHLEDVGKTPHERGTLDAGLIAKFRFKPEWTIHDTKSRAAQRD
jgi:hypothetical protein